MSLRYYLFALLMGLFVSSSAFAQEALSSEAPGVIQLVINALNDYVGGAANFLFSVFSLILVRACIDHYCVGRWWYLLLFLFWLDYAARIQAFAQRDSRTV